MLVDILNIREIADGVCILINEPLVRQIPLYAISAVKNEGGVMMKIGIVVYSDESETVWNAFRFGNFALNDGDGVKVFLLARGVECESLDTDKFKVTEQMQTLVDNGGEIFACGSCLKIRQSEGSEVCPLSTMKDLYDIITGSDKVVTF